MKQKFLHLLIVLLASLGTLRSGSQAQVLPEEYKEVASGTIIAATYVGASEGGIGRLDVHWLSTAGGVVDATINRLTANRPMVDGVFTTVDFLPFPDNPPTNNYSCTITTDVGGSLNSTPLVAAVNLSSATRSTYAVTNKTVGNVHAPAYLFGPLAIQIEGAGSQNRGTIRFHFVRY